MRTVTTQFRSALRESHLIATTVDVLSNGAVILSVPTAISGTVTLDAKAATRGRVDLQLVDDGTLGLAPLLPTDPLAPYGNEIRVRRGITYSREGAHSPGPGFMSYPGGFPDIPSLVDEELVSLGVFRIDEAAVDDTPEGLAIRIAGQDRSARIIDARFEDPYQIAAGRNYSEAILTTLQYAFPGLEYDFSTTSYLTPNLVAQEGDDRWKFCQDMAASIGGTLYFDGDGKCILRPVAGTAANAVDEYKEGERGVLLGVSRAWSRQNAFNRLIVTGENTGDAAPSRGVATDDNPLSPTYYQGRFGKCPRFFSTPFVTTDAQAMDMAQAMLAREIGTTQQLNFTGVVNPALEPDDVVALTRARAGLDEAHILDQLTIPLNADGVMSCTTRATLVAG